MSVSENEVSEMFGYLSTQEEVSTEKVKQVFGAVYREAKPNPSLPSTLSRQDFEAALQKVTQAHKIEEELLYLFYQLDRDKYLLSQVGRVTCCRKTS